MSKSRVFLVSALLLNDHVASPDGCLAPLLVGVGDACRLIGIRKSKLYELVYEGRLTKVKCGGKALITVASINHLVEDLVAGAS